MILLDNVTLLTVDGVGTDINAVKALKYSMSDIKYAKVKYITAGEYTPNFCEKISIPKLTWNDYNKFCLTELKNYIDTDFVLLIQSDGFVINPIKWCNDFLSYDYLGAPWSIDNLKYNIPNFSIVLEECKRTQKISQIGNGGFTIRSKKLLESTAILYTGAHYGIPEDLAIANLYKTNLEKMGLKFTDDINFAASFSCEATRIYGNIFSSENSFGFHCKDTHRDKIKLLDSIIF